MSLSKRATIYFDPKIHKALQLMAIERSQSISELVNSAVIEVLGEDAEDLAAFEERRNDETIDFETFVKQLKENGTL